MSFPNRFFNRGIPLTPILTELSEYQVLDGAKTITVVDSGDLIFGEIGADTDATIGFEYASTQGEQFLLGVGLRYAGDANAFTVSAGDGTGAFTTPIALVEGETYWIVIPPDTSASAPTSITITARNVDPGVEKTGTLSVIDRFDFDGGVAATRTLATVSMSKTFEVP